MWTDDQAGAGPTDETPDDTAPTAHGPPAAAAGDAAAPDESPLAPAPAPAMAAPPRRVRLQRTGVFQYPADGVARVPSPDAPPPTEAPALEDPAAPPPPNTLTRWRGLLLGTALGDALGLPLEGLTPMRAARLFPGPVRHRLLPGYGMISDDTEHAVLVAQALLAHPADASRFARRLAWGLRGWLLGLPAGVGFATLRACLKLWLGCGPATSGVWSAGNGPAMRAAPLGAFLARDPLLLADFVRASTLMTHRDPRALTGALAVARTAAWIVRDDLVGPPLVPPFLFLLRDCAVDDPAWQGVVTKLGDALATDLTVPAFAARLGLRRGVTGYVYHTVPVALYAWARHAGDFAGTLGAVIACGGDTDTTGAIAGALAGALTGEAGLPPDWIEGLQDWPRGVDLLGRLADALAWRAAGYPVVPVRYCWPGLPLRNLYFTSIVLAHGFRRLFPPY